MAQQLQVNYNALEESENKYRTLFENAMEGIFQTDEAGIIHAAQSRPGGNPRG